MSKDLLKSEKKKSGMGKFVLGAALGAGLGILFAPNKGSETRRQLKQKMDELIGKAKDIKMEDVKLALENKIDEIKAELEDLEKGKQIKKKCEDLVNLAIDKGTPILRDAAEEVREKAADVVREVLEKLEKKESKTK